MSTDTLYALCNDATGTEGTYETLGSALDALRQVVGCGDHWVIHEIIRDSIARGIVDGCGPGTCESRRAWMEEAASSSTA
jgi:hypothetical protein